MKAEIWIQTNKVGSRCSTTIEEDDEVWNEMTDIEKEDYMREVMMDQCGMLFDWGYDVDSDSEGPERG